MEEVESPRDSTSLLVRDWYVAESVVRCPPMLRLRPSIRPSRISRRHKTNKWAVLEPHSLRAPCRCLYGIRSSRVSGRRTGVIGRYAAYRLDIGPKKSAMAHGRRPLFWTMRQPRSVMGPGHGTTIKPAMANATIDVIFVRAPGGGRQLRPDKIQDRINRF